MQTNYEQTGQEQYQGSPQQVTPYLVGGEPSNDLVQLALSSTDILDDLQHELLGEVFDEKQRQFVKIDKPILNIEGVKKLMAFTRSIINRNTTFSSSLDEEARVRAKEVEMIINDALLDNYYKWDVGKADWALIVATFGNATFFTMKRSVGGAERDILAGNTKTLIQKQDMQSKQSISEKSGGLFNNLIRR